MDDLRKRIAKLAREHGAEEADIDQVLAPENHIPENLLAAMASILDDLDTYERALSEL